MKIINCVFLANWVTPCLWFVQNFCWIFLASAPRKNELNKKVLGHLTKPKNKAIWKSLLCHSIHLTLVFCGSQFSSTDGQRNIYCINCQFVSLLNVSALAEFTLNEWKMLALSYSVMKQQTFFKIVQHQTNLAVHNGLISFL